MTESPLSTCNYVFHLIKPSEKRHVTSKLKGRTYMFNACKFFFFSLQIFIKVTADGEAANNATTPGKYHR